MSLLAMAMAAVFLQQEPAPPHQDAGNTVDSVTVTATSPKEQKKVIEAFVEDVASETGNGRLARWDRQICPSVSGIRPEYGRFVLDRINAAAEKIGLEPPAMDCRVNVIVVFTADANKYVATELKERPNDYARYDLDQTAGRKALGVFATSEAPVRWWLITHRMTADGRSYQRGEQVNVYSSGRVRSTTRDDFDRAYVIVDVSRVGKIQFSALADYIAFVSLAQIDPEAAPPSGRSILSLFADRKVGVEPMTELTDWDFAYLNGVYGARRDVYTAARQKADIVNTMQKTLAEQAKAPVADPQ